MLIKALGRYRWALNIVAELGVRKQHQSPTAQKHAYRHDITTQRIQCSRGSQRDLHAVIDHMWTRPRK